MAIASLSQAKKPPVQPKKQQGKSGPFKRIGVDDLGKDDADLNADAIRAVAALPDYSKKPPKTKRTDTEDDVYQIKKPIIQGLHQSAPPDRSSSLSTPSVIKIVARTL
jgi:hypothetical protein